MFKGCGQPRLGKRSATTSEINFESVKFDRAGSGGTGTGGANVRPTTAAGTSLDRLVRDIKQKVCFLFIFLKLSLLFLTKYPPSPPLSSDFFCYLSGKALLPPRSFIGATSLVGFSQPDFFESPTLRNKINTKRVRRSRFVPRLVED